MEKYLIHSNELHLIDAEKIGGITRYGRRVNH